VSGAIIFPKGVGRLGVVVIARKVGLFSV